MAQLRPEEIDKLFKKPGEKRYDYFIKSVADTEEVFGLADEEGWLLLGDEDNEESEDILPLFPVPNLPNAFASNTGLKSTALESWM